MKHEYLIDLLKTNKTVIIPNIGAISNNESPDHKYIFNEYLKFNDGMIVKYISSKEGKTMDEAGDDLDKFTQGFADLLSQGKEVVIPQIGIISTHEGKTVFTCDESASSGSIPPPTEKKPEPVVEKKVEPVIEKKPEPVIEKKQEPVVEKKVEPVIEKKPEPVIEKKTEPVIEKKSEPVAEKKEKIKKEKPKKEKSKGKRKKLVWIIIIVLFLGGGGTAGFLFKDQIMEMVGMNETTASKEDTKEEVKEEPKEEVAEDVTTEENVSEENSEEENSETPVEVIEEPVVEEIVEKPVVEEAPKKVEAATSSPGNYYVIVGCFSNQGNADNMIAKITAAGMTPITVGTFDSLIHIAAGSSSDREGALQQLRSLRGTFPSAWIMKR